MLSEILKTCLQAGPALFTEGKVAKEETANMGEAP